jgi:2-epi-5-epi-valiolone synthase
MQKPMSLPERTLRRWRIDTSLPVSYDIVETPQLLDPGNDELSRLPDGEVSRRTRLVILDDAVERRYGARVRRYFAGRGTPCKVLVLPGDEQNKTMDNALRVATALNDLGTSRRADPPIAIGGGVLQDVVGLAASLYRRGIPYIRVPTTLLAVVDVSVAAKTGVNYEGFRNRLGSYSPPPRTLIDTSFLATVPERHISNGLGEILKMAVIKDAELFRLLEEHAEELVVRRFQEVPCADEVISRSIQGMAEELEDNLWEKDLRRIVDYGHSFSPLVEMRALPELLHGEAVALDCIFSAVLALHRGHLGEADVLRIVTTARSARLPTFHPLFRDTDLLQDALADTVKHRNGSQNLPLLDGIGTTRFADDVTPTEIAKAAEAMESLSADARGSR